MLKKFVKMLRLIKKSAYVIYERPLRRSYLNDLDMNMCDYDGRSPLHLAAAEGHLDCVKFLMEICQVDPDPKDR